LARQQNWQNGFNLRRARRNQNHFHEAARTTGALRPDSAKDKPLMELPAIRLSYQKTIAKSLVIPASPIRQAHDRLVRGEKNQTKDPHAAGLLLMHLFV
jgi:hypothetical protein